jgi:SAM-dependent methyltransferase
MGGSNGLSKSNLQADATSAASVGPATGSRVLDPGTEGSDAEAGPAAASAADTLPKKFSESAAAEAGTAAATDVQTLATAINESFRVLKNGGYFISIDRSWPAGVTREVLDSLLDDQYTEPWLIKKGFHNKHLTRRENGEHEYTDYDWISSFEKSGFKLLNKINLHPKFKFIHFVKRIICLLKFESLFKIKIQSRPGIFRGFLLSIFNIRSTSFGSLILTPHPRPLTLFVWEK